MHHISLPVMGMTVLRSRLSRWSFKFDGSRDYTVGISKFVEIVSIAAVVVRCDTF